MKRKTWTLLSVGMLLSALLFLAALVVFIDPFQIYRKATLFMPPIDNLTQVYSNAGIARNYEYDSAVVGTSVTENFRPSQMDALLGGRFIKLCSSAGTAYSHALLMDIAFRTHDMQRIVYGLDVYSFVAELDKTPTDMPLYLYDDNLFNDVRYWFNRAVLGSFLPRALKDWGQQQDDSIRDSMYNWAGRDAYGEIALYNASFAEPASIKPADAYVKNALANLNTHVVSFIEAHPETQFDFFYPPYSAAEWSTMHSKGILEAMLTLRGLCYDVLSGYENVTIYDFAAREEWTLNLDNYKDTLHYGEWINAAMTECIAAGEHVVSSRTQLDAATETLRARAMELFSAGEWIY